MRAEDLPKLLLVATVCLLACTNHPDEQLKSIRGVRTHRLWPTQSRTAAVNIELSNGLVWAQLGGLAQLVPVRWQPSELLGARGQQLLVAADEAYEQSGHLRHLKSGPGHSASLAAELVVVFAEGPVKLQFYTVLLQDKKVKAYGLVKGYENLKAAVSYALYDGETAVTARVIVANQQSQAVTFTPGTRLRTAARHSPSGSSERVLVFDEGGTLVGWTARGLRATFKQEGHESWLVLLDRVTLNPGDEVIYDQHFVAGPPDLFRGELQRILRTKPGWRIQRR